MNDRTGFEDEYPFESQFLTLRNGQNMHFIDEGTGSPILFVHGNPTWSFAWRNLIKDLSNDYRTIAVDHIGCGFSDKPQNYEYTLKQHIDNLSEFVTHLDLKQVTLVAHDWGGAIGIGTIGRLRERFKRVVLMNTAAFPSTRIPFRIAVCRWPVLGSFGVRGLNLFAGSAITMAVERNDRMTPAVKTGYLAPYNNWANRVAVDRFVKDIPMSPADPSWNTLLEVESVLNEIQNVPVLLLWGEKDWCFTTHFRDEFQKRLPNAEVFSIPDAGHYVFEDAHEVIIPRMREFLWRT